MAVDISFIWTLRLLRLKRLPTFRCIICNIICQINQTCIGQRDGIWLGVPTLVAIILKVGVYITREVHYSPNV